MSETRTTISKAIFQLLEKRWQPTQDGYSFFEGVWDDDLERQQHPSWYIYRKDVRDIDPLQMLELAEVEKLALEPQLSKLVIDYGTHYAVNEHVEHALSDFCSSVYDAFDVFEARVGMIAAKQSPLQR